MQNNKIHAFIPGQNVEKFEDKITVANLFIISDFEVQAYKADEKFSVYTITSNSYLMARQKLRT